MTPTDPQAIRRARASRTRRIRRRVVTGAVSLFLATWGLIGFELVSGRDPALASKTSTVASSTASSNSAGTTATTTTSATTTPTTTATTTPSTTTTSQATPSSVVTSAS